MSEKEIEIYIVQNGVKTVIEPVDYGTITLICKNKEVLDIERNERLRIKQNK